MATTQHTYTEGSQRQAMSYGLMTVLCWSTVATAFKLTLNYLSAAQLMVVTCVVSLIFLLVCLIVQDRFMQLFRLSSRQYVWSALFGLMNPTLYYGVLFVAYDLLPAQEAQALNYSWAIVMSLLAVPILGHKLNRYDCAAVVMCYLGVLIIATRGNVFGLEFANGQGVILALLSTIVWSLYWILNRQDTREPIVGLSLNFLFALPMVLGYAAFKGELGSLLTVDWRGLTGGAYLGIFEMGLAFVLWLNAMKLAQNTSQVANLIFISPFLSLVFISLFLDEPILASTLVGLCSILAGLFVQQKMSNSS